MNKVKTNLLKYILLGLCLIFLFACSSKSTPTAVPTPDIEATVQVKLKPVSDDPVAIISTLTSQEQELSETISVLSNDSDVDEPVTQKVPTATPTPTPTLTTPIRRLRTMGSMAMMAAVIATASTTTTPTSATTTTS